MTKFKFLTGQPDGTNPPPSSKPSASSLNSSTRIPDLQTSTWSDRPGVGEAKIKGDSLKIPEQYWMME